MISNHMSHYVKSADRLLKGVKWDLIFDTILLGSESRHCIFGNCLVTVFGSTVGKRAKLTVIKYHISCLVN